MTRSLLTVLPLRHSIRSSSMICICVAGWLWWCVSAIVHWLGSFLMASSSNEKLERNVGNDWPTLTMENVSRGFGSGRIGVYCGVFTVDVLLERVPVIDFFLNDLPARVDALWAFYQYKMITIQSLHAYISLSYLLDHEVLLVDPNASPKPSLLPNQAIQYPWVSFSLLFFMMPCSNLPSFEYRLLSEYKHYSCMYLESWMHLPRVSSNDSW